MEYNTMTTSQSETESCDRCDNESDDLQSIELIDEHILCTPCIRAIDDDIDDYYWYDRYTEEHHERAVRLLEEQDEIECVHESYNLGEIIVHTKYVNSNVLTDVSDSFGLEIVRFHPLWEQEETEWDCIDRHGSCFEILLEYNQDSPSPMPLEFRFIEIDSEFIDENDKQF